MITRLPRPEVRIRGRVMSDADLLGLCDPVCVLCGLDPAVGVHITVPIDEDQQDRWHARFTPFAERHLYTRLVLLWGLCWACHTTFGDALPTILASLLFLED